VATRVVNLRRDAYDVYIGRAGRGLNGYFGNPYPVGERCSRCSLRHDTPVSTLPCFTAYFHERIGADAEFRARVLALDGLALGCFCAPNRCHGDVYATFLNRPRELIDAHIAQLIAAVLRM